MTEYRLVRAELLDAMREAFELPAIQMVTASLQAGEKLVREMDGPIDRDGLPPHLRTFTVDEEEYPCPSCGRVGFILGYLFTNPENGRHQHTHYVCTAWPYPGDRCGWHGWSVPERQT